MSHAELDAVHDALIRMLAAKGARIDRILYCTCGRKTPRMKPAAGHVAGGAGNYAANAAETPFIGDQLPTSRHAGCPRVLVRTGLGRKTLKDDLPQYLEPVAIYDDLAAAVGAHLAERR
jgi:D-glycero-D-manno-heptose 1,7-bisphosphate phosphatase